MCDSLPHGSSPSTPGLDWQPTPASTEREFFAPPTPDADDEDDGGVRLPDYLIASLKKSRSFSHLPQPTASIPESDATTKGDERISARDPIPGWLFKDQSRKAQEQVSTDQDKAKRDKCSVQFADLDLNPANYNFSQMSLREEGPPDLHKAASFSNTIVKIEFSQGGSSTLVNEGVPALPKRSDAAHSETPDNASPKPSTVAFVRSSVTEACIQDSATNIEQTVPTKEFIQTLSALSITSADGNRNHSQLTATSITELKDLVPELPPKSAHIHYPNLEPYLWGVKEQPLSAQELIRQTLKKPLTKGDLDRYGYIYAFWHPPNFGFAKIGRSDNVKQRMADWIRRCGYEVQLHTDEKEYKPVMVPHPHRVGSLIHAELKVQRRAEPNCPGCGSRHVEWFEVSTPLAMKVIHKWTTWMREQSPYDRGFLKTAIKEAEIGRLCELAQVESSKRVEAPQLVPKQEQRKRRNSHMH